MLRLDPDPKVVKNLNLKHRRNRELLLSGRNRIRFPLEVRILIRAVLPESETLGTTTVAEPLIFPVASTSELI